MVYIVKKLPPMYHQVTLEELLFNDEIQSSIITSNTSNTKTYVYKKAPIELVRVTHFSSMYKALKEFNENTKNLREVDRRTLYHFFKIPKRNGRLRQISEPTEPLMKALRELKRIIEDDFGCNYTYHTSAFAYIKKRSVIDCIKRHQANQSRWFGKYDLHDFFGSTTLEFVMRMFSMIFPFSELVKNPNARDELETAIELAFLDGGLPQGTPISPLITNIMMIPIDFELCNKLRNYHEQRYVYTRYADDFQISSRYSFRFKDIETLLIETFKKYGAPFSLNTDKTRYGSSSGSNWNLGLMLNKENKITVGHEKKRRFKAMLTAYILDDKNGRPWDRSDISVLDGLRSYYTSIEPDSIEEIMDRLGEKFGVNIQQKIKADLKCRT